MTDEKKLARLLAKKALLQKAIGEFQSTGEVEELADPANNTKFFNYSHLLPQSAQDHGIRLYVEHQTGSLSDYGGNVDHCLTARLYRQRQEIGNLYGEIAERTISPLYAKIDAPELRGKGIGQSMYSALFAHAKNHCGVTHVGGSKHSTAASKVHSKLAAIHGLNYRPVPNIGGSDFPTAQEWSEAVPSDFDDRFASYRYTLKSEASLNKGEVKLTKPMAVDHYGKVAGLKRLDPSYQGTSHAGEERNRPNRPPRLYFYWGDTKPESIVATNTVKYRGVLPAGTRLYDMSVDEEGLLSPKWIETDDGMRYDVPDLDDVENKLIDMGYHGYTHYNPLIPNALALFKPLKVQQVDAAKPAPKKMRKDEAEAKLLSQDEIEEALKAVETAKMNPANQRMAAIALLRQPNLTREQFNRIIKTPLSVAGDATYYGLVLNHQHFDPVATRLMGILGILKENDVYPPQDGSPYLNRASYSRQTIMQQLPRHVLAKMLGGYDSKKLTGFYKELLYPYPIFDNADIKDDLANALFDEALEESGGKLDARTIFDKVAPFIREVRSPKAVERWLDAALAKLVPIERDALRERVLYHYAQSPDEMSDGLRQKLFVPNVFQEYSSAAYKAAKNDPNVSPELIAKMTKNLDDHNSYMLLDHPNLPPEVRKNIIHTAVEEALGGYNNGLAYRALPKLLARPDCTKEEREDFLRLFASDTAYVRNDASSEIIPSMLEHAHDGAPELIDWLITRHAELAENGKMDSEVSSNIARGLAESQCTDEQAAKFLQDSLKFKLVTGTRRSSHGRLVAAGAGEKTADVVLKSGNDALSYYLLDRHPELVSKDMYKLVTSPSLPMTRAVAYRTLPLPSEYVDDLLNSFSERDVRSNEERASVLGALTDNEDIHLTNEHIEKMLKLIGDDDRSDVANVLFTRAENNGVDENFYKRTLENANHSTKMGFLDHAEESIGQDPDLDRRIGLGLRMLVNDNAGHISGRAADIGDRVSPDFVAKERIKVAFDTGRARKLRDIIMERSGASAPGLAAPVKIKQLPNWPKAIDAGRLPSGDVSAAKLQSWIDTRPTFHYNVSHGEWRGVQRHSSEPSKVFRLDLTGDHLKQMEEAGVLDTFNRMHDISFRSGHPVGKWTIGWVRYTGSKDEGVHIDEVQSDFGQSMARQGVGQLVEQWMQNYRYKYDGLRFATQLKLKTEPTESFIDKDGNEGLRHKHTGKVIPQKHVELARMDNDQYEQYLENLALQENKGSIERLNKEFPEEHLKKIQQIVAGGKHINVLLHEAFQQWMRDQGWHGTPVAIHSMDSKGPLSGLDMGKVKKDRKSGKYALSRPGHFSVTYQQHPVEMGFEPSTYGKLPTQSNEKLKTTKVFRLANPETGEVTSTVAPTPTHEDKVRKFEDAELQAYLFELGDIVLE